MEIKTSGHIGYAKDGADVFTFEMGTGDPKSANGEIDLGLFEGMPLPYVLSIDGYKVLIMGKTNTLPDEIEAVVGGNRILPELLDKRVKLLTGEGLRVYKNTKEGHKIVRDYQEQKQIEAWLNSWQDNGLHDSASDVALKFVVDYYHMEMFFPRWRFRKTRRINGTLPVVGLEHVPIKKTRLATEKNINIFTDYFEDGDFKHILVGNWSHGTDKSFRVYNRLEPSDPLKYPVAMSMHRNPSFGKIYGQNKFYQGIKQWLVGMNKTPRFINSFLENSLSAKVHVIIPDAWLKSKRRMIESYCEKNGKLQEEGKDLIKINGIDIGTEFYEHLLTKFVAGELKKLSEFMSGADNQGKLYSSYSFKTSDKVEERWLIEPIDLKYKEYISALTDNDKRADKVITTAVGMDASVSNVSKDGVISKSGSDLYYNYIIYLLNLSTPERICTEPFNTALKINFPELYKEGYRLGFYINVPSRQEEVSPDDRLTQTNA